jgi:hypothetical protein
MLLPKEQNNLPAVESQNSQVEVLYRVCTEFPRKENMTIITEEFRQLFKRC